MSYPEFIHGDPALISTPAHALRRALHEQRLGVQSYGDLRVSQSSPVGMSVDVAGGRIVMPSVQAGGGINYTVGQGDYYHAYLEDATVTIAAAHATLPRIDSIVVSIGDAYENGGTDLLEVAVVTGTATSGATLDNLTGCSFTSGQYLLAHVLVPAASTTVTDTYIRDRRSVGDRSLPYYLEAPSGADLRPVGMLPHRLSKGASYDEVLYGHSASGGQVAQLVEIDSYCNATKARWSMFNDGANTIDFDYALALYDLSGRVLGSGTGGVSLTVGASLDEEIDFTLEVFPGQYYAYFGTKNVSGSSGTDAIKAFRFNAGAASKNVQLRTTTDLTTVPSTLSALTSDAFDETALDPYVPMFTFSE